MDNAGFESHQIQEIYFFSKSSIPSEWPTRVIFNEYRRYLVVIKRPNREAEHTTPPSV